jgi:tripartite-type tricarboxylate transporter receptor subunit TctC
MAVCLLATGTANAQMFVKPVTIIVPTSTTTGPDIISRELGPRLSKRIGQPVVVENRVGASGSIGIAAAASAAPDGHTILIVPNTITMLPWLHKNLPWDAVNDFRPIGKLAVLVLTLIVNPALPANTAAELIALAKSKPGQLNYASPGNGTPQHLGFELLKQVAGIEVTHIPYKGSSGAITDLVGGQVQAGLFAVQSILPLVKAGRIRILATVGDARSPWTPDAPTFREAGLAGVDMDAWLGALAPKNTPPEIANRLTQEITSLLATDELKEALFQKGIISTPGGSEVMAKLIRDDLTKWQRVVKRAGIAPD